MYSAGYGYANNAAPSFNNTAPQQPGTQPTGQQIMYNQQQQFGGMAPQGAYAAGANPQMMSSAGLLPNPGMPHMAPNGQMPGYQQQFTAAPYGQVVPSSVAPQSFTPNYMMAGGMQGFAMNQGGMPQQPQMMQRMPQQPQQQQQQQPQQPQNTAGLGQVGTPQRPPSAAQATSNNSVPPQAQFSTPQPPSQVQTPTNQQPQSAGLSTPQTPTFSVNQGPGANGSSAAATPLSPGSESRDRERFALLLDINHELLYESIQIQATQQELKKEHAPSDVNKTEENLFQQDYLQCMRRLQANLSYMAALADRKPEVKAPPCPAYLTAPPLNLSLKPRALEGSDKGIDLVVDREERDKSIKELYSRLQAVFPGFDPKKEPVYRVPPQGGPQGQKPNPGMSQASPTAQKTPQMTNMPAPPQQPMQYQPILQS
ncbi:hypothetical protein B0T10DRAFT_214359 [Thelonectria olida]|uniref:Glutamine repeat protein-1 n=1 Tax=Thelonectria olida TaxID=1576542 RepID=A0A9P8WA62_9HYPO|nr:hypothetical protein B0T10DRAFT_214359 [Thelonectria olida]